MACQSNERRIIALSMPGAAAKAAALRIRSVKDRDVAALRQEPPDLLLDGIPQALLFYTVDIDVLVHGMRPRYLRASWGRVLQKLDSSLKLL
jgi:hypothetical protein